MGKLYIISSLASSSKTSVIIHYLRENSSLCGVDITVCSSLLVLNSSSQEEQDK